MITQLAARFALVKKTIFWDLIDDQNEESGIQHSLTVVATLIEFLSEFKTTSNGFLLPKKNELLRVEFNQGQTAALRF